MAVLDGQEVISALAQSIRAAFTTAEFVKLYKDTPVQNMQKPCVFLHSVNTNHQPRMRNNAMWHYIVDVRCHPKDNATDIHTWARGVAVRMLDVVTRLQIGNTKIKATDVEWNIEGGVLHVIVKYSISVRKTPEDIPDMETLEYGEHVRQ